MLTRTLILAAAVATWSMTVAAQAPSPDSLRVACDAKNGAACDELGRRYLSGEGVAADDTRARELLDRACAYGEAIGCSRLGFMHETGRGVRADAARAAALYTRGCEAGAAFGCTRIGLMYANGRGVARDDARAVGFYRRGCDGGDGGSCSNLGMMIQTGRGAAPNDAAALALYKRACDGSDGVGCAHLGLMYDLGLGAAANESAAIDFYRRACELGGGSGGCLMLGFKYANGRGVAKDEARALSLFERGCNDEEPNACDAVKEARGRRLGLPVAPAVAPPVAPAVPATLNAFVFSTPGAELVWQVKPDRTKEFEAAWKKLLDGLARSNENRLRLAARGMSMFRLAVGPTPTYFLRIDPVIAGLSYQPGSLLAAFAEPDRSALYKAIADNMTSLTWMALEDVRLRVAGIPERSTPPDAAAASERAGDLTNWAITTDRAEVLLQIKDGQGPAFERVWQEIVAGMERSRAGRLRQAAQNLTLWRAGGTPLNYILRIDPVIDGIRYDPTALIYGAFVRADADELFGKLSAALLSANVLPLVPVD
jgi:TPR repeat protein